MGRYLVGAMAFCAGLTPAMAANKRGWIIGVGAKGCTGEGGCWQPASWQRWAPKPWACACLPACLLPRGCMAELAVHLPHKTAPGLQASWAGGWPARLRRPGGPGSRDGWTPAVKGRACLDGGRPLPSPSLQQQLHGMACHGSSMCMPVG